MQKIAIISTLATTLILSIAMVYFGHNRWKMLNPNAVVKEIPPPDKNDHLVISIPGNPAHLNPLGNLDTANEKILPFLFESLISVNPQTRQIEPRLAESWKVIDDGLIFEFKIREGIEFHDHRLLTGKDVFNTFEKIQSSSSESRLKNQIQNLSTFTLPEPNTIRFKFKNRHFKNLTDIGLVPILSEHSTDTQPIGTGAYFFKSWDTHMGVDLVRNLRYWGSRIEPWLRRFNFNAIRFLIIPEEDAALDAFKNESIDCLDISSTLHWKIFDDREFHKKFHHITYTKEEGGGYSAIGWNLKLPPFDSKEIRLALLKALDRREINEQEFRGQKILALGPFSILSPKTDRKLTPIAYDLEASQKALNAMGWLPDPRNGTLTKNNQRLEFEIIYDAGNSIAAKILHHYQETLKKLGVIMTPRALDTSEFIARLNAQNFSGFLASWNTEFNDDLYKFFHSSQIPPNGNNFVGFQNVRVDKIINDTQFTLDTQKRNMLYAELQNILRDEMPYFFLYERDFYTVIQTRFSDVLPMGIFGLNMANWSTPLGKEKYKD